MSSSSSEEARTVENEPQEVQETPEGQEAPEGDEACLTPEELDALTSPDERDPDDAVPFDLHRPRVLRPHQREWLEGLFDNATKLLAPILKRDLGTEVVVEFVGGDTVYLDKFLAQIPEPINIFPVNYRGYDFQGLLCLDAAMAFWFVDTLLGGGAEGEDRNRSLTDTESAVAKKVVEQMLDEVHTVFAPTVQVECDVEGFVGSRVQTHTLKPPPLGYLCTFRVQWRTEEGQFQYVVPIKTLRPLVRKLEPKSDEQRAKRLDALFGSLGQAFLTVDLNVAAVLGEPTLSLRELTNLKVGDVLPLGRGLDEPIEVAIQGKPKLTGAFGVQRGRYAVVIQKWLRGGR